MDKKTCTTCHEPIPDDSVFCPYCGASARVTRFCRYCGTELQADGTCPNCAPDKCDSNSHYTDTYIAENISEHTTGATNAEATTSRTHVWAILLAVATCLLQFLPWVSINLFGSHSWNLWETHSFFVHVVEDESSPFIGLFYVIAVLIIALTAVGSIYFAKTDSPSPLFAAGALGTGLSLVCLIACWYVNSEVSGIVSLNPGIGMILTLFSSAALMIMLGIYRPSTPETEEPTEPYYFEDRTTYIHNLQKIEPALLNDWIDTVGNTLQKAVLENWNDCIHNGEENRIQGTAIHHLQCIDKVLCYNEEGNCLYLIFSAHLQDHIILSRTGGYAIQKYFAVILENLKENTNGSLLATQVTFPQLGSENILGPYNSHQEILNEINGIFRNVSR